MTTTDRRRPLSFEQMEQRLTLSATPVGDYVLTLGTNWQLSTSATGGTVSLDQAYTSGFGTSGFGSTRGTLSNYDAHGRATDAGFIDYLEGEFIFTGPVFSTTDPEGGFDSNEATSPVAPIPQPQIGQGEIADGIIVVAEIFHPTSSPSVSRGVRAFVENEGIETAVARKPDDSWKSISLSRGRDVYLEVAALTEEREPNGEKDTAQLSSKIAPLIYQQTLLRQEAERSSSTTSEDRVKTPKQLPPLPQESQQEPSPADSNPSAAVPLNIKPGEKVERTAQEGESPKVDEFSQVAGPRDHAFAVWNEADELSDELIALRTETQEGHSATWPVLAALAATGWIARTRRSTSVLPRHRQPLPRK